MTHHAYNVLLLSSSSPRVDYVRSILFRPLIGLTCPESVLDALLAISQGGVDLVVAEPRTPMGSTKGLADQLKQNRALRRPKLLRVGAAPELAEPWPVPAASFYAPGPMAEFDRTVSDLLGIGVRRHPRYLIRRRVGEHHGTLLGTTIMLSLGGMLLSSSHPLTPGNSLEIELLDLHQGPLALSARVLRREDARLDSPGAFNYALEFLDLTQAQRRVISALLFAGGLDTLAATAKHA